MGSSIRVHTTFPGAHYWKGNCLTSNPPQTALLIPNQEAGQSTGAEVGPALTDKVLLGLLSGPEQVWRGGPCPGLDHRTARAEEQLQGWGRELCGARTEQDSEGPVSYALELQPTPESPGALVTTQIASPTPEFLILSILHGA